MVILIDIDVLYWKGLDPGAPLTYFNDGGGGGKGQKGFFWVYERRRDFLGSRKQRRDFFGYCIFHQLKSTIT